MGKECEYCMGNSKYLVGGRDFGDVEFAQIKNGVIATGQWVEPFTSNAEQVMMSIPISYCPMCGRNLEE